MDNSKNVIASTTMWGAALAVLGTVLGLFGYDIGVGATDQVAQAVGATVTAFGALWVVVERYKKGDLFIKKPKV